MAPGLGWEDGIGVVAQTEKRELTTEDGRQDGVTMQADVHRWGSFKRGCDLHLCLPVRAVHVCT